MGKYISIIEPDAIFRMLLKGMVESIDGFEIRHVIQEMDAWPVLLQEPPDIVLMDLHASGKGICPCDVISRLAQDAGIATIILGFRHNEEMLRRAFECGAVGYLLKSAPYAEIRANLELAQAGGIPLSSMSTRMLIQKLDLKDASGSGVGDMRSPFVVEVEELIDAYLGDPSETCCSNLSDYLSRRLTLSYSHISTLYRNHTGVTLGHYRQLRRIEHVKMLLRNTGQTLTQIADTMKYSSVAHLSSSFHRMTGMRPSDFRRQVSPLGTRPVKNENGHPKV